MFSSYRLRGSRDLRRPLTLANMRAGFWLDHGWRSSTGMTSHTHLGRARLKPDVLYCMLCVRERERECMRSRKAELKNDCFFLFSKSISGSLRCQRGLRLSLDAALAGRRRTAWRSTSTRLTSLAWSPAARWSVAGPGIHPCRQRWCRASRPIYFQRCVFGARGYFTSSSSRSRSRPPLVFFLWRQGQLKQTERCPAGRECLPTRMSALAQRRLLSFSLRVTCNVVPTVGLSFEP